MKNRRYKARGRTKSSTAIKGRFLRIKSQGEVLIKLAVINTDPEKGESCVANVQAMSISTAI
jgi:hypothetical protein